MASLRCVVIGAGLMGAAAAARLAASGAQVTLLDQDRPGRHTSHWTFAWLNSNDKGPRHYHDLNQAGIRAWADLARELDGAAWHRPAGHVELATDEAARAGLAARVRRLAGWGYPAREITLAQACDLEPALRPPPQGTAAAWFPEEGYLLTEPLIARLVARAADCGAQVRTGDEARVTAIDPEAPRVRTASGAVLDADRVLCCAGRWTPELAALADPAARVPLLPWQDPGATAPELVVRVAPSAEPAPVRVLHTPELAVRPHAGGQLHLEAPDAAVDLHTPDHALHRWAAELLGRARRTIRTLDHAQVTEYHVCVRPLPQDGHPIVGPLPGAPKVYVAVTHSGATLAAHLAGLIAAELLADSSLPALAPYRPHRFSSLSRTDSGSSPREDPGSVSGRITERAETRFRRKPEIRILFTFSPPESWRTAWARDHLFDQPGN